MICPKCGVLLPDNVSKCGNCGFSISNKEIDKTVVAPDASPVKAVNETVVFMCEEEKPIYGWLVIIEGPNQWKEFRIPDEPGQHLIGTDETCAFRLMGEGIERFHASLRLREGKLFITDLDTEEGTYLNNKQIAKAEVQDGDRIKIGSIQLKFRKF